MDFLFCLLRTAIQLFKTSIYDMQTAVKIFNQSAEFCH